MKYTKNNRHLYDFKESFNNSNWRKAEEIRKKKQEKKKPALIVYLKLKGKWSSFEEEVEELVKVFKVSSQFANKVVEECVKKGYIEFPVVGLFKQLNSGYKHTYNLYTGKGGMALLEEALKYRYK